MWQLQRMPLNHAVEILGRIPPVFVIETTAWRAEGIPKMAIGYSETSCGIELVSLALFP
jgi:hypothetical protein